MEGKSPYKTTTNTVDTTTSRVDTDMQTYTQYTLPSETDMLVSCSDIKTSAVASQYLALHLHYMTVFTAHICIPLPAGSW